MSGGFAASAPARAPAERSGRCGPAAAEGRRRQERSGAAAGAAPRAAGGQAVAAGSFGQRLRPQPAPCCRSPVSPGRTLRRVEEESHQPGSLWLINFPCKTAPASALSHINEVFVSPRSSTNFLKIRHPSETNTCTLVLYVSIEEPSLAFRSGSDKDCGCYCLLLANCR